LLFRQFSLFLILNIDTSSVRTIDPINPLTHYGKFLYLTYFAPRLYSSYRRSSIPINPVASVSRHLRLMVCYESSVHYLFPASVSILISITTPFPTLDHRLTSLFHHFRQAVHHIRSIQALSFLVSEQYLY